MYYNFYLIKVVQLTPHMSGLSFMIAQITDGIATVATGYLSDKISTRWGKRMPWYYVGSLITIVGNICFFGYPSFVKKYDDEGQPRNESLVNAYYTLVFSIFNIGWAFV